MGIVEVSDEGTELEILTGIAALASEVNETARSPLSPSTMALARSLMHSGYCPQLGLSVHAVTYDEGA